MLCFSTLMERRCCGYVTRLRVFGKVTNPLGALLAQSGTAATRTCFWCGGSEGGKVLYYSHWLCLCPYIVLITKIYTGQQDFVAILVYALYNSA